MGIVGVGALFVIALCWCWCAYEDEKGGWEREAEEGRTATAADDSNTATPLTTATAATTRRASASRGLTLACSLCRERVGVAQWRGGHRRECARNLSDVLAAMPTPYANLKCPKCDVVTLRQWPNFDSVSKMCSFPCSLADSLFSPSR